MGFFLPYGRCRRGDGTAPALIASDGDALTNRLAIILGTMVLGAFVIDWAFFGGVLPLFLGQKLADLIEYVAFWR